MKVPVLVGFALFVAVVLGLMIGFAGSVPAPVAASGVAAPNVTNTPKPTVVPVVRLYRWFKPTQSWSTPAAAWSDIKSRTLLANPTVDVSQLDVSLFVRGKGYALLNVDSGGVPDWSFSFDAVVGPSDRVYVVGVDVKDP